MRAHLHPLAIATNILQASGTQLDHVTLMFGFLYKTFMDDSMEEAVRVGILTSLAKQWNKNADHDIFIMAVFLNPYIRARAFCLDNPALVPALLYEMAQRSYTRIFEHAPDADFHIAFWDYMDWQRQFSVRRMGLDEFEKTYKAEVSSHMIQP